MAEEAASKRSRSGEGKSSDDSEERRLRLLARVSVGTRISLYWPDDEAHYSGTIGAHYPNDWQRHVYRIDYDDGEMETIDLATEQFRILEDDGEGEEAAAAAAVAAAAAADGSGAPEIRSLTVRFDERREAWRSPPTYYAGEDFVWPEGWIEVQRQATTEEQLDNGGRRWIIEFHPPRRTANGKGGRGKVCHSIDEVKRYIERQQAQQLKKERQERRREESLSRRTTGRKRTNPNQTPTDPTLVPAGTQADLNKIMRRRDRLSERMRRSILLGAVLARKKNILGNDVGFLGADGRTYPGLRLAFGKHVDARQCALCKSRVQGHWYCRIAHGHVDKPDHDGGNSVEGCGLVELFRCSVEELEERLWSLLPGGGKIGGSVQKKSAPSGFEDEDWSMNLLSEDLLYQIASFLPTLAQLAAFCKTSKRGQHLLYRSVHSEPLLRGVFLRAFGERGARGNFEQNLSWRERWSMVRDVRRGLSRGTIRGPSAVARQLRETVGVLPPQDESEAVFYDNPNYGDPEGASCNGYFGMEILHLPPPPNAGRDWKPPIVLTGDFNGIRIFSQPSQLFYESPTIGEGSAEQNRFITIGADEGGGQVLSLIQCDRGPTSSQNGDTTSWVCCYIGFMSGRVSAISVSLTSEGNGYTFAISESVHSHDSEVTALAFLTCGPNANGEDLPILFSACCAGKVYYYPTFSPEGAVLAFSNYYDCPIFSMASAIIHSGNRSFSLLCTGDRDGNIRIWLKQDDLYLHLPGQKFKPIQMYRSSTQRGTGYHLVTKAMFIHSNLLITGTNNGDVRFWQLQVAEDPSRALGKGPLPVLNLRYDLMNIHNGAVELLVNIGDVLLTSGGKDGSIVGWDISTGMRIGEVRCHPGRQIDVHGMRGITVRSCVVDMLMSGKDGILTTLCRDGSLKQLKFGAEEDDDDVRFKYWNENEE